LIGNDFLRSGTLLFQPLEPLYGVCLHPTIPVPPETEGCLAYANLLADLGIRVAGSELGVCLAGLADDLLRLCSVLSTFFPDGF
jgi:hypothetical protein